MAKELIFTLNGSEYAASPSKLERKKIYGWSAMVATDKDGAVCSSAYLYPDASLLIPQGGLKQAIIDEEGKWVEKTMLKAFDQNNQTLPIYASSFDTPIVLDKVVGIEEFLDNEWESVYQLFNSTLAEQIGDMIYTFPFIYKEGVNRNDGYLLNTPTGLFLFAGGKQTFELLTLADQTSIDELEENMDDIDELDFSMF